MLEFQKYVKPEFIILDSDISTKKEFFSLVTHFLSNKLDIKQSKLLKELTKREKLGSTGIGDGIAIPHCRVKSHLKIQILVVISKKGIEFSAIDSKPVHLFFVIVASPEEQVSYFRVLSHLAKRLEKNNIYEELLSVNSNLEAYNILMKN